jgi:hypothetical protein
LIAPDGIGSHQFAPDSGVVNETRITSTVIRFDVAVAAEHKKSGTGGAGIKIAVVKAKLGGEIEAKDSRVSRVQFSVPILMPLNPRDWSKEKGAGNS